MKPSYSCALSIVLFACVLSWPAWAIQPRDFSDPQQQARYQQLIAELRCLVCQNESLAESQADLAEDLRNEIDVLVRAGRSEQDIKTYLTDRYGDFVLYNPPVKVSTYLLWFGPFALMVGGLIFLIILLRGRSRRVAVALTTEEQQRLKTLLQNDRSDHP